MKARRILNVLGNVNDAYIEELFAEEEAKPQRRSVKKAWLIAAIVAVMLVLVGCVFVYVFQMQDLKIGEDTNTKYYNGKHEKIEPTDVNRTVITLHGIEGSATYLAAQEWYTFREEYDKRPYEERLALDVVPEAYIAYNAYTQELIDKVDEICKKYKLKTLGPSVTIQQWESKLFKDYLGFESVLEKGCSAALLSLSGYCYEGGNFKAEFLMRMAKEDGQWPYKMLNSMYYSKPDYFDDVYAFVEDIEHCEQWEYTTKSGNKVLIVVEADGYGAKVICNRNDALIYVTIENYYNKQYSYETNSYGETEFMTRKQLEQVVDQIDFSLTVPGVIHVKYSDPYANYIAEQIRRNEAAENYEYALMDLNGDGVKELITQDLKMQYGDTVDMFLQIYTVKDGEMRNLGGENYYPIRYICEGGILEEADDESGYHAYYRCTEDGIESIEMVSWQPEWKSWTYKHYGHIGSLVSEEQAKAVIESYKRTELDMKPFAEYPFK